VHPPGHGGLVARLGDEGEVWGIGPEWEGTVEHEGPLLLGINDFGVGNNSGEFQVEITVTRRR
jgi:hypothetical protein